VLTGDGRYVATNDGSGPVEVFLAADGSRVDLGAQDLRGQTVPYRAGSELALWLPSQLLGEPTVPGRLTFWSIDALRAGKPGLVREHMLASDGAGIVQTGPCFSPDGRFFAVEDTVHDLLRAGTGGWGIPDALITLLVPAPGGRRALALRGMAHGRNGGSGQLALHLADGGKGQQREMRPFPRELAWSPDGRTVALLDGHLRLMDPDTLADLDTREGPWHDLAWLDERSLLLIDYDGSLSLHSIDAPGPLASLELRASAHSVEVDARGRRAVVALADRLVVVEIAR
jgi:hypothetical protein